MKRLTTLFFLLFACIATVGAQSVRTEKPREILQSNVLPYTGPVTVAFWNLEWFPAGPAARENTPAERIQNHINAVAQVLDELNPAIFIACEVRSLSDAKALNSHLKKPYPFVAVSDFMAENSKREESNANRQEIAYFSRIPWKDIWEVDFGALPTADDRPARGFVGATFIINSQPVTIFATHPKSNFIREGEKAPELTALKNVEKRERAARFVLADMQRHKLDPLKDKIIVVGDFNCDIYAERFQGEKSVKAIMQAGFYDSFDGLKPSERVTIPSKRDEFGRLWPDGTFDYILTSVGLGKLPATVRNQAVKEGDTSVTGDPGYTSDHNLVRITLPAPGSK